MKKLILMLPGTLITLSSFGQEVTSVKKTFLDDPFNDPMLPYYLVFVLILISAALVSVVGIYLIRILNILTEQANQKKATTLGIAYTPTPGWWQRFTQKMNASVPVADEKDIEMDHIYDGIKELDNHLPPWWTWLFYGTIAWAAIYIIAFHFSNSLPLSVEEYNNELAVAEEQAKQRNVDQPQANIDENSLAFTNDAVIIEKGKNVFANNPCGSCHRHDGGGNTIGPNLTDEYWIHGGDVKSIFNTIKNGAVDKGMPAWGKNMSAQDVRDVAFYIVSLQGSNPPEAKAPQGEIFKQSETVKTDSTHAQANL
jgi:cytochrome c oxidase cbb3-type subunit III